MVESAVTQNAQQRTDSCIAILSLSIIICIKCSRCLLLQVYVSVKVEYSFIGIFCYVNGFFENRKWKKHQINHILDRLLNAQLTLHFFPFCLVCGD